MKTFSIPVRLLIMQGAMNMLFIVPVVMAFYRLVGGLTLADFLLMQGLFRLTALLLEIPTGYLADRWQRHRQIQVAVLAHLTSLAVLFWVAQGFWGILVAEALMAVAAALSSGTLQAYLHEALRQEGQAHTGPTWQSRMFATCMGAEVVASLAGGWLFTHHPYAPVGLELAADAFALVVAFTLPMVPRQKGERRHPNPWVELAHIAHHSTRAHPLLAALSSGPYVLFGFTGLLFWGMLGQWNAQGVSTSMQGVMMSSYFGTMVLTALAAPRLQKSLEHVLWKLLPLGLALGLGLVAWAPHPLVVLAGGMVGAGATRGLGQALCTHMVNAHVADHERATTLSLANTVTLLLSAAFMVSAPVVMGAGLSLSGFLLLTGGLTLVLATPACLRLSRQ